MYTKVSKSDAVIRKISDNKIVRNYITRNISLDVSLAISEATDYSEKETTPYNRIYYVLDGTLALIIENEKVLLTPGDACFVEKGTTYEMRGTFKVIMVNQPAFGT